MKSIGCNIYVINLDKNTIRWANIQKQFKRIGIEYSRFSAFNGKDIELSPWRDKIHPKALDSAKRGYRYSHGDHSYGSIGCFISHVKIWYDILKSGKNEGIVFEDDISIPKDFVKKYTNMMKNVPQDWDLILFGPHILLQSVKKRKRVDQNNFIFTHFFGTNSYVITADACRKMLQKVFPIQHQIDWWMSFYNNDMNIWLLEKPITSFNQNFPSDINHTPVVLGLWLKKMKNNILGESNNSISSTTFIILVVVIAVVMLIVIIAIIVAALSNKK